MKKTLTDIGIMLFTTFIMLLICELVIRFFFPQMLAPVKFSYDKDMGLRHVPLLKGKESYPGVYDFTFTNGKDGFRETHKGELPKFINKKLMLLGDSFTYGKGVSDNETYAYGLQAGILKDSAQIINAGVEGRGTDYCLRAYQFYKDKYQPNTVIYFAHYNDLADNIRGEYYKIVNDSTITANSFAHLTGGTKEKLQNSKTYNWLVSHSHFFAMLKSVLVAVLMKDQTITYDAKFDIEEAKKETTIYLNQLVKEVKADGRKLFVYYVPAREDLDERLGKNKQTEQEAFFEKYCNENNVTFHNFSEDLLNSGLDKNEIIKHFYLLEGHWNKNGHQLASEQLKKDAYGFY